MPPGCVPLELFYYCDSCNKCEPGWAYPVHRENHCSTNTSVTYGAVVGSHFDAPVAICENWRIQAPDCDYSSSKIRTNIKSSAFSGHHVEMKLLLKSDVECDGPELIYYEAKGFMVGERGFIFSVSHSFDQVASGGRKDSVVSGDFSDATRRSFTATEMIVDAPSGANVTTRALTGTLCYKVLV